MSHITREAANADAALHQGMREVEEICASDYETLQDIAVNEEIERYAAAHLNAQIARANPWNKTTSFYGEGWFTKRLFFVWVIFVFGFFLSYSSIQWLFEGFQLSHPLMLCLATSVPFSLTMAVIGFRKARREAFARQAHEIAEGKEAYRVRILGDVQKCETLVRGYLMGILDDVEEHHVNGESSPLERRLRALRHQLKKFSAAKSEALRKASVSADPQVRVQFEKMAKPIVAKLDEMTEGLRCIEAEQRRLAEGIAGWRVLIENRLDPIKFAAEHADLIDQGDEALIAAKFACVDAFEAVRTRLRGMERHIAQLARGDAIVTDGREPSKDFDFRLMLSSGAIDHVPVPDPLDPSTDRKVRVGELPEEADARAATTAPAYEDDSRDRGSPYT